MTAGLAPFRHWIIDGWCDPCGPLPPVDWEANYENDCERGKRTTRDVFALPADYRAVFARLGAAHTVDEWVERTNIPGLSFDGSLHGAGLHVTEPGGFLQVHVDYERHPYRPHMERRLSLIAFLHAEWRPEWGGELLLCDPTGRAAVRLEPRPGRLVAFEGGPASYHGVRRTAADAPPRVTAAAYCLAPARASAARLRACFLPNRNAPGCPAEVA